MANQIPVNIQSSLAICSSLTSLIGKSFGPNAQLVMYTTSTGKVLLTSDGRSILGALHVSHPIGRWLIDRVVTFAHQTGNHTKSFIFIMNKMVEDISHQITTSLHGPDLRCKTVIREQVIQLVRALNVVKQDIFPEKVLPALMAKSQCFSAFDFKALKTFGENLIHTYLQGRVSLRQSNFMSKLLWKFIYGYAGSTEASILSIKEAVLALQDNFHVASVKVVGLPVESSSIRKGIILSRCFVNKDLKERKCGVEKKSIIIFGSDISKTAVEADATISARTVQALVHNMQHTRLQMMRIVNLLQDNNIDVVLCSECLSATLLSLLHHASITVIQALPVEELQRLSHFTGINILYEMPREFDDSCIGIAEEVQEVTLGNHRYSQIVMRDGPVGGQLVLCAPSEGMCMVLSHASMGAITCVKMWLDGDDDIIARSVGTEYLWSKDQSYSAASKVEPSEICMKPKQRKASQSVCNGSIMECENKGEMQTGYLISGGGAAEIIARDILTQNLPVHKDNYHLYTAIRIISNALLCIPERIHRNSFAAQSKDSRSFIKIINDMQSMCRDQRCEAWGIDGQTGEPSCTFNRGVVEVLRGKFLLWINVIEAVIELLNMDTIIPVQGNLRGTGNEDDKFNIPI
ncbi:Bardet-Biedl syndrome 10 protein homolog [Lytechinus pictus]|uniref:Bardet-Biedl syndrome 10 protein homolog n=1 Tax=Lytechinus pictus TaxID=7653 RepID=UPI0030B9EE73